MTVIDVNLAVADCHEISFPLLKAGIDYCGKPTKPLLPNVGSAAAMSADWLLPFVSCCAVSLSCCDIQFNVDLRSSKSSAHCTTTPPKRSPAVVTIAVLVSCCCDSKTPLTMEVNLATALSNASFAFSVVWASLASVLPVASAMADFLSKRIYLLKDWNWPVIASCRRSPPHRCQVEGWAGRQQPEQRGGHSCRAADPVPEGKQSARRWHGELHSGVGHQVQRVAADARRGLRPDQRASVRSHADQAGVLRAAGNAGQAGGRLGTGGRRGEHQRRSMPASPLIVHAGDTGDARVVSRRG